MGLTLPRGQRSSTQYDPSAVVARAAARCRTGGAEEALTQLRSEHGRRRVPALRDMVFKLASALAPTQPADSLQMLNRLLKTEPAYLPALALAGPLHDSLGEKDMALERCVATLEHPDATSGQILAAANLLVRLEDKPRAYAAAVAAFDAAGRPLHLCVALLYIAQRVADFDRVAELTDQLAAEYAHGDYRRAAESPRQNVLWCGDLLTNIRVTEQWSRSHLPLPEHPLAPIQIAPVEGRRIRVGYLSSDFRDHPTSRLVNGLFRNHDRSRFELFMYCSGWDDQSAMRREVESHVDHVHSVAHLSNIDAARLMREHRIDILVELNGPTRAHRMGILCHRPAPVQIDYLGWPGSVGGRIVDYVVGDEYTVPEGVEKVYPERVIRLSKTYQVNDHAYYPLGSAPSRASLGLPESGLVLGMFNAINKVSGEVWAAWMEILRNVPDAVLWVLNPGEVARRHLASACKAAGVSVSRVIAAPYANQEQHLQRMQVCDLMLDPWPYGGHTSTTDALYAGVPVVAMAGQNFAGRVSGGLLRAAGLEVLVRRDVRDYVTFAVNLLRNPSELARTREWVRDKAPRSALFDARLRTRELERAYETALKRVLEGLPPCHMNFQTPVAIDGQVTTPTARAESTPVSDSSALSEPSGRIPLIVVCGPWSSGTSAVAGLLARAGLQAPGPYVKVNDPRTRDTYEMKAFQAVLRTLASEQTLTRLADAKGSMATLRRFRDGLLRSSIDTASSSPPVMLKHGLAALFLNELAELFDVRIVSVLRPLSDIENTRRRRKWKPTFGRAGAEVIYSAVFHHLINSKTPFYMVRYEQLVSHPEAELNGLFEFCGVAPTPADRASALEFISRRPGVEAPVAT